MSDTVTEFSLTGRVYDLLYHDKDSAAEVDFIQTMLGRVKTGSLLELGCGTGRHTALLAQRGFQITAVDRSDVMLAQARGRAGDSVDFVLADVRDVTLPKRFDAAVSLFHVVSYQTSNADLRAIFEVAHRHLKPGGRFLFDVWYGPAVLHQRAETRIKRVSDADIEVLRIAEPNWLPNENVVEVNYTLLVTDRNSAAVSHGHERHRMRYCFLPELRWIAEELGFQWVDAHEWLTGRPPSEATWGVCVVLEK